MKAFAKEIALISPLKSETLKREQIFISSQAKKVIQCALAVPSIHSPISFHNNKFCCEKEFNIKKSVKL